MSTSSQLSPSLPLLSLTHTQPSHCREHTAQIPPRGVPLTTAASSSSAPCARAEIQGGERNGAREEVGAHIRDDSLPEQAAELLRGDARPCRRARRGRGALLLHLAARTSARIRLPPVTFAIPFNVHPAPPEGQTHGLALRELLEESQPRHVASQGGELRSVGGVQLPSEQLARAVPGNRCHLGLSRREVMGTAGFGVDED